MFDEDPSLQVDLLAAALKADQSESASTIEFLAKKFELIMPAQTTIVRGGWFLSAEKPVEELTVTFDDAQFRLVKEKHGSITAKELKTVRGVVLKSKEIPLDQWITLVANNLSEYASKNAKAREVLKEFLSGDRR